MKVIKKILLLIFLLLLAAVIFTLGYYFAVTKDVYLIPEKLLFTEETITLYDKQNQPVRGISNAFFKQTTSVSDIPQHTVRAFIDTEDKRFYQHRGYDIKRIAKATVNNVKSRSLKEGASTISQQLIKNTHLTQEKTFKRKMQEWKLTRALEKRYSKNEILERYLNTIYFGHGRFGITAASEFYFNKSPSELSIDESAVLAGLVKSPNRYSPFHYPENCVKRKNTVLALMQKNGSITQAQQIDAAHQPLPLQSEKRTDGGYANFVFDELSTLAEEYSFTIGGKIEIYTYLDPLTQKILEESLGDYAQSDKAAFILDEKTHGFKACVSTVGNVKRLPGSLIKPLLVYAPALEENLLSPATPILDVKVNYGGYSPENYDGKYHGYVSARECVEKSLNIPAVKTLECLTVEKGAAYLEKLGLSVLEEDKSLALALGGMKNGFPLKDIVTAYSSFPNGGKTSVCGFISAVKVNGTTVYDKPTKTTQVFSEETACLMTDILKGTAKSGTAKKLRALPFEIAAKTGTVGSKSGNTDAYALSYTTNDCIAVWLGNANNAAVNCTGGGEPCNLLYRINEQIYKRYQSENIQIENFRKSAGVRRVDLDKTAYENTHTLVLADELSPENYRFPELFKESAIPTIKSTAFSKPTIVIPMLTLRENQVIITFDERSPDYYDYKIIRDDGSAEVEIYEGELPPSFTDRNLEKNKSYRYTVIPIYKNIEGIPVVLPTVTTKEGNLRLDDCKILSKEWWEY